MAEKKKKKGSKGTGGASTGGSGGGGDGERRPGDEMMAPAELVVVARKESRLQVTAEGVASESGEDTSELTKLLESEGIAMHPLFGETEQAIRQDVAEAATTSELPMPDLSVFYQVEAPEADLEELCEKFLALDLTHAAYVKPPTALAEAADTVVEDVGVTAYKGASPLVDNKTFLEAAAGILAAEAYHAGIVRTSLYARGLNAPSLHDAANRISDARDSLDNGDDVDQGITEGMTGTGAAGNIVPLDANGIAYSRTPGDVLNIVYLDAGETMAGGFFPNGVNGALNASSA